MVLYRQRSNAGPEICVLPCMRDEEPLPTLSLDELDRPLHIVISHTFEMTTTCTV